MALAPRISLNRHERPEREPDPRKDRDHMDALHELPCVVCGTRPVHVHHLMRGVKRGMGYKAADKWGLPFCMKCHSHLHATGNEEAWLADKGIDGRATCRALFKRTGDYEAMLRITERART